jgi:tetratricopeptide (TPR) repeat protein
MRGWREVTENAAVMLNPTTSLREWLLAVRAHVEDTNWLSANEDELYPLLKIGLQRPREYHDAVEIFLLVIKHYALVLFHAKRWASLLMDALSPAQELRDSELQARILTHMGEISRATGKHDAARRAFTIALERAVDGQERESMLASYTGLIRMQSVSMGDDYDPDMIARALALSCEIDDLALIAGLHISITVAYIHMRQTIPAIEHGQIAYVYAHHLNDEVGMGNALYLLSAAYRFALLLERAEAVLQYAADRYENTPYSRQYARLAYEAGAQYLHRREYEAGKQWLAIALEEAVTVEDSHITASAYHSLGLAETGLKAYVEAAAHLRRAYEEWEKLGDQYEVASAYQAMGYLEIQRRNSASAEEWLRKALLVCQSLPPSPNREWLEGHIQATIDEIPW